MQHSFSNVPYLFPSLIPRNGCSSQFICHNFNLASPTYWHSFIKLATCLLTKTFFPSNNYPNLNNTPVYFLKNIYIPFLFEFFLLKYLSFFTGGCCFRHGSQHSGVDVNMTAQVNACICRYVQANKTLCILASTGHSCCVDKGNDGCRE